MKRLDKATDAQLRQIMAGKATTVREIVAASLERGARFRVTTEYGVFLFEVTGPINPVIAMEPLRRGEYAMPDRIEAGNRFSYSAITVLNNNEAPVLLPRKMSPSIKLELLE